MYHRPVLKNLWQQTFTRTSGFVRKAGTTILTCSTLVWLLVAYPASGPAKFASVGAPDSLYAVVARTVSPIFVPLGFGNWEFTGSLLTGLAAKEVVVTTLTQSFLLEPPSTPGTQLHVGRDMARIGTGFVLATWDALKAIPALVGIDLRDSQSGRQVNGQLGTAIEVAFETASNGHGALAALAFLVFVLLYTPCISALTATLHELGLRWMALTAIGQFVIAWLAAFLVFRGGMLLTGA